MNFNAIFVFIAMLFIGMIAAQPLNGINTHMAGLKGNFWSCLSYLFTQGHKSFQTLKLSFKAKDSITGTRIMEQTVSMEEEALVPSLLLPLVLQLRGPTD
ncbi:hypothetical protein CBL_13022 [Carabus blaptoides fortunei]